MILTKGVGTHQVRWFIVGRYLIFSDDLKNFRNRWELAYRTTTRNVKTITWFFMNRICLSELPTIRKSWWLNIYKQEQEKDKTTKYDKTKEKSNRAYCILANFSKIMINNWKIMEWKMKSNQECSYSTRCCYQTSRL